MRNIEIARTQPALPQRRDRFVAVTVLILAFLSVAVRAEDWPQWRGPNRDGVFADTGIMQSFPEDRLNIRWRAAVGPGWSSPVVSHGRVYASDSELVRPKANERMLCFEEATGKPLWTYSYDVSYPDWAFVVGQEGRQTATPIVQGGNVYALGGIGQVLCLDAAKGDLKWEKRLDKEYEVEVLKCRASALIEGDLLILLVGGKPGAWT